MGLADKLLKAGSTKTSSMLGDSKYFKEGVGIPTRVHSLNIALSGSLNGGLLPGVGVIAGPTKHFKSNLTLELVRTYLDDNPDGMCIFYDNEFGTKQSYFEAAGVDFTRVIHIPVTDIEELKFDMMKKLEAIDDDDKVIIMVDSLGNLASKKEVDDALDEKSVADMTRAKQLKSLFRMVTPHLKMKGIPMVNIAHTYQTQEMYSKDVISGGTGLQYAADWAFIVGRRQVKDGKEVVGYDFIINIDKSRFVKEKSALPYSATFENGVDPYSGLLDIALITGHVEKPKQGWYARPSVEDDKNWRRKETSCDEFWSPILEDGSFHKAVSNLYSLKSDNEKTVDLEEIEAVIDSTDE